MPKNIMYEYFWIWQNYIIWWGYFGPKKYVELIKRFHISWMSPSTIDHPESLYIFKGLFSTRVLFSKAFSDCIKRYGFSIETSRKHLPLFSSIFLLLFGEQETKLDRVRFSHPILNAIKSIVNVLTNKSLKITLKEFFLA